MTKIPYFGALREMPIRNIRPEGWLREFLVRQRNGLTGHLEVAGYPFNTDGWRLDPVPPPGGHGKRWWPYEQVAYWVDGMTRCGYLLDDPFLIRKARRQLDFVLQHPDADGYLGPSCLKSVTPDEKQERWPHAVLFRAMMAYVDATGDARIVKKLSRHYLSRTTSHSFGRNSCNIEILCWLYGQTKDRRLLNLATKTLTEYQKLHAKADTALRSLNSKRPPTDHGVNFTEIAKLPAIHFLYTGNRALLRAAINGFHKLDKHHLLISGVPSSTEHLRGINSLAGHETCDIADYTWSLGYLLMATGNTTYADQIERACFNAAPGAVTKDFKALQYFSSPNQVVADHLSNHHIHGYGFSHMSFRPNPATECCPGNVNRIVPNYAARMWMSAGRDVIAAVLYGPSRIKAKIGGSSASVTIHEETRYPFEEEIRFRMGCRKPVTFSFWLRIPGWCRGARMTLNEKSLKQRPKAGTWFKLRREFRDGDRVTLSLPMQIRLSRWPEGGVGVERGPLVFSLPVKERRVRDKRDEKSNADFPAWRMYPEATWNFALAPHRRGVEEFNLIKKPYHENPWNPKAAPLTIEIPARRVPGWKLVQKKAIRVKRHGKTERLKGKYLMTSRLPSPEILRRANGPLRWISLVPMGCTHLRLTIFPKVKKT